jgi:hypothetical protein
MTVKDAGAISFAEVSLKQTDFWKLSMKKIQIIAVAAALTSAISANAAIYDVYARANSSSGGVGKDTITLTAGQAFSVTVNPNDLWNAGDLPRWSNADGLVGDLLATGSDESGYPKDTVIGQLFPDWTQENLTAPYGSLTLPFGSLVGQIGSGGFFLVGTSFSSYATSDGTLKLYYWDSYAEDNTQHISADVSAVPEPSTYIAGLSALGMLILSRRNRK